MTDYTNRLQNLTTEKLIDVVKNYRQYGYDEELRNSAISLLEHRGISREELKLTGNFQNKTYDFAHNLYTSFRRNSKIAFVLYIVILLNNILIPVLSHNSEILSDLMLIANFAIVIGYFVFLIKSFFNQNQFYKSINQDYGTEGALMYFLLGMPFYFIMFFYFRNQMKEKMKEIK
ncbi:hypothetical protein [Aestuariibaculum suncheonense]|uniref:Uncharacterized protein n=1 Tax=Aestuariibaculum suncheonense TaxID=1028745 RepID=A0A8J6Q534_9FLAO|nr:hypothetical protein [Aestuariibaculum suncheonense]MBD0835238.1 hypothetical protein [Aestuariibaculum suncheonense]